MNYNTEISDKAKSEIRKAEEWYDDQSLGLVARFLSEINEAVNSLRNPQVDHKIVFDMLRRILLPRFPYVVYYIRDEQKLTVKIIAVLHNKQSGESLEDRI